VVEMAAQEQTLFQLGLLLLQQVFQVVMAAEVAAHLHAIQVDREVTALVEQVAVEIARQVP